MDGQTYGMQWIGHHVPGDMKTAGQLVIDAQPPRDGELLANGGGGGSDCDDDDDVPGYIIETSNSGTASANIDQIAAENLIFMAHDGQMGGEMVGSDSAGDDTVVVSACDDGVIDCQSVLHPDSPFGYDDGYPTETTPQLVMEEVITDDWVQPQGEERVEIPAEQILASSTQGMLDIEVPLPTVQDEYTALRPYPCDFCSRRFRKRASLLNHMVAHQSDRPHLCKLCGSRFFRRSDLINHLKSHADAPDPEIYYTNLNAFGDQIQQQNSQHQHRGIDHYYDQDWNVDAIGIPVKAKSSRLNHTASGNSSPASSPSTMGGTARGRISRIKPKAEIYSMDEYVPERELPQTSQLPVEEQEQQILEAEEDEQTHASDLDYVECSELQASTAAVKLTQDPSPDHQQLFPIIDDSKPFVCQQCGLAFAREKALNSHFKRHRNSSPYECMQCNEFFWDASDLQDHQRTHQFEDSNSEYDPTEADEDVGDTHSDSDAEHAYGEFYCSECGMAFHRQHLLQRHAKVHLKTSAVLHVSAGDEHVTGDNNNIKGSHCCNTCGETFTTALDLLAHAEIHARHALFKCVLCGESFFEETNIKHHLQTAHAREMTENSCILCGKECRDRKALIKHAWDHSREKCHSCSKCGKSFHNKARLKRHMASHRDKSVVCDVCNEEFPDGRTLSNHRHSHSTAATGKLFPCNECGKTFGSRSSQQIHVRIHTGERPYGCRFCWKAFADGGTLRKHERIHTGEKPYECSVCPRAFNQRVVLREHIRSHHSGIDTKTGTYHCSVCDMDLMSSTDLIQHLIQHSDNNTAMQRQPVTGPRKYKRRRKLKPHEIERMRGNNKEATNTDIDLSDFDIEHVGDLLGWDAAGPSSTATSARTKAKSGKNRNKTLDTSQADNNSSNVADGNSDEKKMRYHSTSSNSGEKLWQSKLINLNSSEESYKLLSNLEHTLQSIDTLVVDDNHRHKGDDITTHRTAEVAHSKLEAGASRVRKRVVKSSAKVPRPRMIHTERQRSTQTTASGSKRRAVGRSYVTRTEATSSPVHLDLLTKSTTTIVDDYEIISPALQPPNQISSSPVHIKQEHDSLSQHNHGSSSARVAGHHRTRKGNFYDAQLLLDASTLRKESYEKFNPNIVNDLEEILRSPVKAKSERQRFTSESSTQYLAEQFDGEEQHLIKIEPTSPVLQDFVAEPRSTRSTRSRVATATRKYIDTNITSSMSTAASTSVTARNRNDFQQKNSDLNVRGVSGKRPAPVAVAKQTYLDYTAVDEGLQAEDDAHSSIAAVVSAAHAVAAVPVVEQQRRRYFECEMCSAVFADRALLLDHVPIHI